MGIKIGNFLEDELTGIKGLSFARIERLSGSIQYGIQPKGDGEKAPEAFFIDVNNIKVLEEGIAERREPEPELHFELGEEVEDRVSGFKGVVVSVIYYFNGCVIAMVEGKIDKEGKNRIIDIDYKRLKVTGAGVSDKAKEPVKKAKTGGPRAPASRCA